MAGTLWIGTRKGLFALRADGARRDWKLAGPQFLGHIIHHVVQDPRAPRVLLLAAKTGHLGPTVFRSTDRGRSWREAARPPAFRPVNEGAAAVFLPDPSVPFGHDPHCMVQHPARPERLYQQNHCGIYRLDRPQRRWQRIGKAMPKKVGDIGFPIVLHPTDPDTAWVLPMDGQSVWP